MLHLVPNSALSGGVQLAAFVQQQQQDPRNGGCQLGALSRGSCTGSLLQRSAAVRPAVAACGLLVVASACCPPRPRTGSGRLQMQASRSKLRRRRRGSSSGSGGDSSDDDSSSYFSGDWSFESSSFYYGGNGGSSSGGGSGGWPGGWGSSGGGDAFHRALFESMWVWQVLCAASMLQSVYFLLFPAAAETVGQVDPTATSDVSHVAMAC